MKFTRLYTGDDGESHFEDFDIPLHDHGIFGVQSEIRPAGGIVFRTTEPENEFDWHNAPHRQYVITLHGGFEIEVGDGTVRQFGPEHILLAEDTTGRGHLTRPVGNTPRSMVFVTLD